MASMRAKMLNKNEEVDADVTWEDQQKICTFGRLVNRLHEIEDDMKAKKEEILKITDALEEIYISEDTKFSLGEVFVDVEQDEADEMLNKLKEQYQNEAELLEREYAYIQQTMAKLKVELYAKFGKSINLEESA
eukprot:GEZU01020235.1.p4 GENE.GEZU01020235.1~~GEZU01020235.1.p4  ORF type:complete len:134 (+),score=65.73 GEZU01020235.1:1433-1834(+)